MPEAARRIRARNPLLHAFVSTRLDEAMREHEERSSEPPRSVLHGLPYGLKDSWDTAGIPTTGGSYRQRDRTPTTSAPIHLLLQEAGAILMGKTNLSDMAMSVESASYVGGVTANPLDLTRTAGGSSGGAAAAVADGMIAFDWGSDFGGSIRHPVAFCGVYGLRLSSETWPVVGACLSPPPSLRYMNGQGPIAADLPTLKAVVATAAPRLRTGPGRPFALRGVALFGPGGPGLAGQWPSFARDVTPALARAAGEILERTTLPSVARAFQISLGMFCAHLEDFAASDPMGLWSGIGAALSAVAFRGRLGDRRLHARTAEVLLGIALARVTLYRDRPTALRDADLLRAEIASLWDRGYVIAAPVCTFPAPRHGTSIRNPLLLSFALPANVVDATALALPFGTFARTGLPRSLQLWGPPGSELALIEIGERLTKR